MAHEWRAARIEEVAEKVAMGPFGSSIKVETFVPTGVPVISGQHLRGFKVAESVQFNFVSYEHADRLKNANVQRGDIIFTHAGNIGQVAYVPEDSKFERYVISQRQFYMRCDRSKVIPEFVVAYFKTPEGQHKLLANASQVGVPSIAQPVTYLRTIEILVPPLPEQRAIAQILGTLDDKIELNWRMNETLEAIARAIFKSWFVDFDPVRAKAEGRDHGLPKEITDLFPDSFEDLELGEIPKGWGISTVGEEFILTMGQSPPGETYNDIGEGIPFFQGRADFGFRYPSHRVFCTAPTRFADPGDTLVSVRAPVGDINMALERCSVGRGVAAIRHKSSSRSYTYHAMFSLVDVFGDFEAEGTVFGCINKDDFHRIKSIAPPPHLVLDFEKAAFPIDQTIENNIVQSRILAALRDALLPKLIFGEIRTKDVKKFMGGIV
jgi:type I restriction enzyme S subunit